MKKDPPRAAFFEADGSAWELEAVERIAYYLGASLPEGVTVLR